MTKPIVFSYSKYKELRDAYEQLLEDNNRLMADNKVLRETLRNTEVQLRILKDKSENTTVKSLENIIETQHDSIRKYHEVFKLQEAEIERLTNLP